MTWVALSPYPCIGTCIGKMEKTWVDCKSIQIRVSMGIYIKCVNGYLYKVCQWVFISGVSMGINIKCVNGYLYI